MVSDPRSWSWLSEIRFESYPGSSATWWNSILWSASEMDTVTISLVWMTCPTAVTKSMLLAFWSLNSIRLLQKWRNVQESRNQILLVPSFCNHCSLIINAFPTGPCTKGLGLELCLCLGALLLSMTWCVWFGVTLCIPLLPLCESPLYNFSLRDCWVDIVVLLSFLSERKQSLPKSLSLW